MGNKVELLSPAGSPEGLYGALNAGADAVYLGGARFGARAYADNFTTEELVAGIRYAHQFGRRIYLTVNTLMKEAEIAELCGYLRPFYEAGLDGVIVQDLGALAVIRRNFPELRLHASTQMTITGSRGAKWIREQGVCRVVPARELSLEEIRRMKAESGLEFETFIHGAMCYCYSGQCLFSSVLGGRSGNRGRCAQPCRLPYRVGHGRELTGACYPLSLKDLCTIECLPALIEAEIDSFKIEGRMKKPEYTAGVTAIYRKYIDRYYQMREAGIVPGSPDSIWKIEKPDLEALSRLYIRSERQDGYYFRRNGREMVTLDDPAYSAGDEALLERVREQFLTGKRMKHPVEVHAKFVTGEAASVEIHANINGQIITAAAAGHLVESAQRQPVTEEQIRRQLSKLGDTAFEAARMDIRLSDNAFYPMGEVNELRRMAAKQLGEQIGEYYGYHVRRAAAEPEMDAARRAAYDRRTHPAGTVSPDVFHVSVCTDKQLEAVTELIEQGALETYRIGRLYLEADLVDALGYDGLKQLAERIAGAKQSEPPELVLALPRILRDEDREFLERVSAMTQTKENGTRLITGVLARNIEGFGFLHSVGYGGDPREHIYADASFYMWNSETPEAVGARDGICLPIELKAGEQHALVHAVPIPCEKIFYGRVPMMVTANCVAKTTDDCRKGSKDQYFLLDRYKKKFPVVRNCKHCYNVIYNSLPLSLHREWNKWKGQVIPRFDLTVENDRETDRILRFWAGGCGGDFPLGEYTTGHEKKGTE